MRNVWYAQMMQAASDTIARFIADEPANDLEELLFKRVREAASKARDLLNSLLKKDPVAA